MTETHQGGCLCGAIRYEIVGELRPVVNCHCGMCLKFHGHYGAYTAADRSALRFLGDKRPAWYHSSDVARRGFCADCGSSLFWERLGEKEISIAAGTLDQPTGLMTEGHIFTADKGDYYQITDGLEQHPGSKFWADE